MILVDGLKHGQGGLEITKEGGTYTVSWSWNPPDTQTLGLYDLCFWVSDGMGSATDVYENNLDELTIMSDNVGAEGTGSISGKVTKLDKITPIQGALVKALQGMVTIGSATTNAGGSYTITLLAGIYTVVVRAPGYYGLYTDIVVKTGQETSGVNFALATATFVYVDDDNTTNIEIGTSEYPYNTIQEGITGCFEGGTVSVDAGTYTEAVYINKQIALVGTGSDKTIIDITNLGDTNAVTFDGTATNGASISGFKITGAKGSLPDGSGISCINGATITITNNMITGNRWCGIYACYSSPTIINNIITRNTHGIWCDNSLAIIIINNTIVENSWYGIMYDNNSSGSISNNIITENFIGIRSHLSFPIIDYNCLYMNVYEYSSCSGGSHDILKNPQFIGGDDYHLGTTSPCIDAGTDTVIFYISIDADGKPRKVSEYVDIGAYEYQGTPTLSPKVNSITPKSGLNTGTISITICGSYFQEGAKAKLSRQKQADIHGTNTQVLGVTTITTTFDLTGAKPGKWDVVVTNLDARVGTLTREFLILMEKEGIGVVLEGEITVVIPPNIFKKDYYLSINLDPLNKPERVNAATITAAIKKEHIRKSISNSMQELNIYDAEDNPMGTDTLLISPIITVSYPDTDQDGIVDGTTIKEDTLVMFILDEKDEKWVGLPDSEVAPTTNIVSASTPHFSAFVLMGTPTNQLPTVGTNDTTANPGTVIREGPETTTISATFYDIDSPPVASFTVTFKVRDSNGSETILVDNKRHLEGDLEITDGGGTYTASYDWDPPDNQGTGTYDLYFSVSDGYATATDGYENNLDELTIAELDIGSIYGTVTKSDGITPIPGVIVKAFLDGNLKGSATTNINGTYSITNIPVGSYTIEASKAGYETQSNYVSVGTTTIIVDFKLEKITPVKEPFVFNYPNPARGNKTTFRWWCQNPENATIDIYDISYEWVDTLKGYDKIVDGYYEKDWNVSDIARGVYVYVFKGGGKTIVKKVMVIK